jgi:hypothetical protein
MKNIYAIAFFPAIAAIGIQFLSCASIEHRQAAKKCRFELTNIEIEDFSLSDMTLALQVNVTNPDRQEAVIDRMDLDLFIENKKTVNVVFDGVTVPPGETKTMNALMAVPYSIMGLSLVNTAQSNGRIQYRLAGTAYMKTLLGVIKLPVTITKN